MSLNNFFKKENVSIFHSRENCAECLKSLIPFDQLVCIFTEGLNRHESVKGNIGAGQ